MSGMPADNGPTPAKINLKEVIEHSEWKSDPLVGFEQRASLAVAQWVLILFAGVYLLAFSATFLLFWRTDATFEKGADLIRFMISIAAPFGDAGRGVLPRRQEPSSAADGTKTVMNPCLRSCLLPAS